MSPSLSCGRPNSLPKALSAIGLGHKSATHVLAYQKLSNVRVLVYLLYNVTLESTFENVDLAFYREHILTSL